MRLFDKVLLRIVGIAPIDRGRRHIFVERMSCPNHHGFQITARFFRSCDKVIAKFVRVVIGEQSLESRINGIHVRVLRFLEVDIRQHSPEHGRERNGTGDFASAHFGLARGAGQHFVFDADNLNSPFLDFFVFLYLSAERK